MTDYNIMTDPHEDVESNPTVDAGLSGTSALVLGGGGIGAEVVRDLAGSVPVTFTYAHHEERALALRDEMVGAGRRVQAIRCDARTEEGAVAAFDAAEEFGPIGRVVFCVGGWDYPRIIDLTKAQIDESLALNLVSALLALRESTRRVIDNGRIVLLSSASAHLAPARQSTYAAAKAGLEAAARVAAKELARRGVTVNVVRPGATDTAVLHEGTSERAIEAMSAANAMRRLARPRDIAGVIGVLLSEDLGWVTGDVIDATGGLY